MMIVGTRSSTGLLDVVGRAGASTLLHGGSVAGTAEVATRIAEAFEPSGETHL